MSAESPYVTPDLTLFGAEHIRRPGGDPRFDDHSQHRVGDHCANRLGHHRSDDGADDNPCHQRAPSSCEFSTLAYIRSLSR